MKKRQTPTLYDFFHRKTLIDKKNSSDTNEISFPAVTQTHMTIDKTSQSPNAANHSVLPLSNASTFQTNSNIDNSTTVIQEKGLHTDKMISHCENINPLTDKEIHDDIAQPLELKRFHKKRRIQSPLFSDEEALFPENDSKGNVQDLLKKKVVQDTDLLVSSNRSQLIDLDNNSNDVIECSLKENTEPITFKTINKEPKSYTVALDLNENSIMDRTPRLNHNTHQIVSSPIAENLHFINKDCQLGDNLTSLVKGPRLLHNHSPDWNSVDNSITICEGDLLHHQTTLSHNGFSQDDPTPIPIPRRSMPASLSFIFNYPCQTPLNNDPSADTPIVSLSDIPKSETLSSTIKPNSRHRHTMELGQLLQRHHVLSVPNNHHQENHLLKKDIQQDDNNTVLQDCSSITLNNIHSLGKNISENDSDHDDIIESESDDSSQDDMIPATSEKGVALLKGLQQESTHSTSTGSLFGSCRIFPGSSPVIDIASPKFDPEAFNIQSHLYTISLRQSIKFSFIANVFDSIEALKGSGTGSKKKVVVILTNVFRLTLWYCPQDLIPLVYICLNKTAPDFLGVEMGIGETMLLKLVTEVYGRSEKSIKTDLSKYEDLGRVAELSRCKMRMLFRPPPLTVYSVFHELKCVGEISGHIAQNKKKDKIKKLLVAAEKSEPKYLVRFLQGRMRMGVQTATIYQALAYAFTLTYPKIHGVKHNELHILDRLPCSDIRRQEDKRLGDMEAALSEMDTAVRSALSEVSNIEVVISYLFDGCTSKTLPEKCVVTPGIPVQPMLAKPTKGIKEVFQRFADCDFTCEFKYDGERAQIHLLKNKTFAVFSRNLENLTTKYPDLIDIAKQAFQSVSSYIRQYDYTSQLNYTSIDSEVVAFDTETQRILPFQVLSTRKRKGVESEDIQVKICVFAFDCIQFNGQSLIKLPFLQRREFLHQCITEIPHQFMFAKHAEMNTVEDIDTFLQEAIEANCEGLMVKTLKVSSSYEPSKRSLNWLKIKKDYLENLTDSIDLVPIGGYLGRGKRSKVYGAFLLACFNQEEELYQTVCKAGTGFSDDVLESLYAKLKQEVIPFKDSSYQVDDKLIPDVWFRPCNVWEIRAADLSLSPIHTGAIGLKHVTRGIGLRFPRFIRERDDKQPEMATTAVQIVEMYNNQTFNNDLSTKTVSLIEEEHANN